MQLDRAGIYKADSSGVPHRLYDSVDLETKAVWGTCDLIDMIRSRAYNTS